MSETWNIGYRDEGIGNLYPFADGSTLVAGDGLVLDRDLFVDATLYPVGTGARLGLTRIDVEPAGPVVLWVGDPADPGRASAAYDPVALAAAGSAPDRLAVRDPHGRPAGLFLVDPDRLLATQTWPAGSHAFATGAAEFALRCVIPLPAVGVRALTAPEGVLLTGDVWLAGRDGVVVREEDGAVRIDIVGDPLATRRACAPRELFTPPRFIKALVVSDDFGNRHRVEPDAYGEFHLVVGESLAPDTVLRITSVPPDTVKIEAVGKTVRGG